MKGINDQDYKHAQQVCNRITPEHKNFTPGDYHDVYLATDVVLLTDVFETLWNTCLEHYKLDPAHFYTAPGLAWQALLKTAFKYYDHEVKHKGCALFSVELILELLTNSLLKVSAVGLPRHLKAMPRPIISICKSNTILTRRAHIFSIWTRTMVTSGQWSKNHQHMGLHKKVNLLKQTWQGIF